MDENFERLLPYNFWDGNVPELGYPRRYYTDKVFDYIGNKLVKVLVGQRRAGKSYIMRQLARRLIDTGVDPQNVFFIDKEFIAFD